MYFSVDVERNLINLTVKNGKFLDYRFDNFWVGNY